jgi:hypothetical protein
MKIDSSRGRSHVSVNRRNIGDGLVIMQGQNRVLLSPDEWRELREAADGMLEPPKRYRMA